MDFNKLWQSFMDTVQNHYVDFNGRVGRARFWYYILVCVVVGLIAAIAGSVVGLYVVGAIVSLALLLPTGGMAGRRVQDVGQNGQLVWIWVVASGLSRILVIYHWLSPPTVTFNLSSGFSYYGGYGPLDGLVGLVALLAAIVLIYFCVQPGQAGGHHHQGLQQHRQRARYGLLRRNRNQPRRHHQHQIDGRIGERDHHHSGWHLFNAERQRHHHRTQRHRERRHHHRAR